MPRLLEVCLVLLALVLLAPVMAIVALLIWAVDGSPVMFGQTRAGKDGSTFRIRKFRSLTDLRGTDGALLADEDRHMALTPFLRRSRIDELPQLFSILAGDMALVGPRPLLPVTIDSFGALGLRRSSVRPGVTGWAQVSGNTALSNEEKLTLDLWYAAHRTLALDLRILAETVGVVLYGETPSADRLAQARDWMAQSDLAGPGEVPA